ncbi:MAG: DegT/DnrJ/EryC1/StrS family aminotransferase [Pyrinomonadaceae bacterium]
MNVPLFDLNSQYPAIGDEIRQAAGRVFDSQQFVLGAEGQALEEEIARYCQTKFAVGCASGSDALLLALMSCGIAERDEVITTPFTFFATAAAIARLGARPVFVDIDERTFNMDHERVEAAISQRTRAIIAVHLYGQCVDMNPLIEVAAKYGIPIIEDVAQALGAEDRRRRAGSIGTIGCLSFYPSKNLGGAGDGGMLITSDGDYAKRLQMLHVHGEATKYHHDLLGINSRLDELQAAVLRVKLPHLEDWTRARERKAQRYELRFTDAGLGEHLTIPYSRGDGRHVFHLYVIRVAADRRDKLREHLGAHGVGNGVYYPVPQHLQKCFAYLGYQSGSLPLAESAAAETIALPIYPELTDAQQDYVVSTVAEFFR